MPSYYKCRMSVLELKTKKSQNLIATGLQSEISMSTMLLRDVKLHICSFPLISTAFGQLSVNGQDAVLVLHTCTRLSVTLSAMTTPERKLPMLVLNIMLCISWVKGPSITCSLGLFFYVNHNIYNNRAKHC